MLFKPAEEIAQGSERRPCGGVLGLRSIFHRRFHDVEHLVLTASAARRRAAWRCVTSLVAREGCAGDRRIMYPFKPPMQLGEVNEAENVITGALL